jgi:hypothetical protein
LVSDGLLEVELIVVAVGWLLWVLLVVGGVLFNSVLGMGVVG